MLPRDQKPEKVYIDLTMSVPLAVDVSLLTLAVMTTTVRSLHDTRRPVTLVSVTVTVAVARAGLSARGAVQEDEEDEEDGGTGDEDTGGGVHVQDVCFDGGTCCS